MQTSKEKTLKNNMNSGKRIRSSSADTRLIKKSFIAQYKQLSIDESAVSYVSLQINLKRFQLIRMIHNTIANYASWKDLLNQQITIHYQVYPIVEEMEDHTNSNLNQSHLFQQNSGSNQVIGYQRSSQRSYTPLTNQETNSIETAQNLIKILLKKEHIIAQYYKWNWIQLFGNIYNPKQWKDLDFKILLKEIIQVHRAKFNTRQYLNITNNKVDYQNHHPLLLILYQHSTFKQAQKQRFFKKIINQIAFIRLLQIAKLKNTAVLPHFQLQYNIGGYQSRKQKLQRIMLLNKRPIQFFIVVADNKSIQQLFQNLQQFYINLFNLISIQYNVVFNFLITQTKWQFDNIEQIAQYEPIINDQEQQKSKNQQQQPNFVAIEEQIPQEDEYMQLQSNQLDKSISNIEMVDESSQNQSSFMLNYYLDQFKSLQYLKQANQSRQNGFKKKRQPYLDYQNKLNNRRRNTPNQNKQQEQNKFTDKFLQLIFNKSQQNKKYYEKEYETQRNDNDLISEVTQKKLKKMNNSIQDQQKEQKGRKKDKQSDNQQLK